MYPLVVSLQMSHQGIGVLLGEEVREGFRAKMLQTVPSQSRLVREATASYKRRETGNWL